MREVDFRVWRNLVRGFYFCFVVLVLGWRAGGYFKGKKGFSIIGGRKELGFM